jgi:DNA repair protein RadA/Sms
LAKLKSTFICQSCGNVTPRWAGRCEACGEWNSIVEEVSSSGVGAGPKAAVSSGRPVELVPLSGESEDAIRIVTKNSELDRVLGGGFVMGSAILVGGDPGIGKSTLLLQAAAALARQGKRVVYISGEEAIAQVRLRATRLGVADAPVELASETHVETILATIEKGKAPDLVIIDSIQTCWTERIDSAPGTVTQVRTSAQALTRFAKKSGAAVVLVGHVTKDGQIAGPRVVEHMVDAVLYFEGDTSLTYRILRGVKNRYGATDEIGVFEMVGSGLREVPNPSALFLDQRDSGAAGSGARGRCWWKSRPSSRPPRWERRAGRLWAGIPRVSRWCSRCSKPGAGFGSEPTTSISTSRAASRSMNPPPIWPWRRHSSPRSPTPPCPPTPFISARSAFRAA